MLEISVRKVAQVAMMARELGRAEGELRAFIDRMSEDQQSELVAIMWVGRGSFEAEELGEAVYAEDGVQPMRDEDTKPFAGLAALRGQLKGDD